MSDTEPVINVEITPPETHTPDPETVQPDVTVIDTGSDSGDVPAVLLPILLQINEKIDALSQRTEAVESVAQEALVTAIVAETEQQETVAEVEAIRDEVVEATDTTPEPAEDAAPNREHWFFRGKK